jgi:calcium-dependent protein kinase
MDHPGILKLYEFFEDDDEIHIVTEICEGGDLFDYIVDTEFISEAMVAEIMQ